MQEESSAEKVIYRAEDVKRYFHVRVRRGRTRFFQTRKWLRAVDGVSFELKASRTLAIVGESGCGKSTLARVLLRLIEPTGGRLYFRGTDICALSANDLRLAREHVQMIFQDPYSSLHPRRTVANIIAEPWHVHPQLAPANFKERIVELLDQVGLSEDYMQAYPGRLSGGERQRISIARALAMKPEILILDEPVSALDVSIQAQIIRLIMELQKKLGIAYVFISHDLPLVRLVADEIAVMYMGRFVEMGRAEEIFAHPRHPYTQLLLSSSPERVDLERPGGASEPTSPFDLPRGCRFQPRCPKAQAICGETEPGLEVGRSGGQLCACHFAG